MSCCFNARVSSRRLSAVAAAAAAAVSAATADAAATLAGSGVGDEEEDGDDDEEGAEERGQVSVFAVDDQSENVADGNLQSVGDSRSRRIIRLRKERKKGELRMEVALIVESSA